MPGSFQKIRDRLPSLYRPEDGDQSLVSAWLRSVGAVLDRLDRESDDVLRAHWFPYADQAPYHPYFLRVRLLQKTTPLVPLPSDPAVQAFPYIQDLARLAALLPVAPWEQPPAMAETVEEYRRRIGRIVAIYRRGLGSLASIRDMVEAQLPANRGAASELVDRPFWLEEFAPLVKRLLAIPARGEPLALVGPLMRWTAENDGLAPAAPTIYIRGVSPQADLVDATVRPMIELYEAAGRKIRVGIGFADTIAADQALRMRPTYRSWLGLENGLVEAESRPTESRAADPTAPGPWSVVPGAPAGSVPCVLQTSDLTLWVASGAGLHAFNGAAWSDGPGGLAAIHALAEDSGDLLIAVENGLLRMPLHPDPGPLAATAVAAFNGHRVNSIFRAADSRVWLACDNGAFTLGADDAATPSPLQNVEVLTILQDLTGTFFFGTASGLFQWQPVTDAWFAYEGSDGSRWRSFDPAKPLPSPGWLPPVFRIWRGGDASLWLGTGAGIARYTATEESELEFESRLEAFPDLTIGNVSDLQADARGLVWFATDRGLFRFDGRDLWQFRTTGWVQMGSASKLYPAGQDRGVWRFNRTTSQWERFATAWTPFTGALRSTAEASVLSVTWTTGVLADLGTWDGSQFTNPVPVDASKIVVRYKPSEDRIVPGGLPGIPSLPAGGSIWRYLSMEADGLTAPEGRPWWTPEGRLVLPPPTPDAPGEGRYDIQVPPPPSDFDEAVFAYNPAAAVWFEWASPRPLGVLIRLKKLAADETIDPAVAQRVFASAGQVRPAGVRLAMAIEEDSVTTT